MSAADTSNTVLFATFAGRRRKFCLRLGEMEELERHCGVGIGEVMLRVAGHRFRLADIRETIRLGLEGGGEGEATATALVMRYVDGVPISPNVALASGILTAALSGVPADDADHPGNAVGERIDDPATSPPSSAPEPPSVDLPPTSAA